MTRKELMDKYPSKNFGLVTVTRDYEFIKYSGEMVNDRGWKIYLSSLEYDSDRATDLVDNLNFAIDYCNLNK
jgi:hypothetical protein